VLPAAAFLLFAHWRKIGVGDALWRGRDRRKHFIANATTQTATRTPAPRAISAACLCKTPVRLDDGVVGPVACGAGAGGSEGGGRGGIMTRGGPVKAMASAGMPSDCDVRVAKDVAMKVVSVPYVASTSRFATMISAEISCTTACSKLTSLSLTLS